MISTSEIQPVNKLETNVTEPCGEIPIKLLNAVRLYDENSWRMSTRDEGFCVNISVQSMMTRTVGNFSFMIDGIDLVINSRQGHYVYGTQPNV